MISLPHTAEKAAKEELLWACAGKEERAGT